LLAVSLYTEVYSISTQRNSLVSACNLQPATGKLQNIPQCRSELLSHVIMEEYICQVRFGKPKHVPKHLGVQIHSPNILVSFYVIYKAGKQYFTEML